MDIITYALCKAGDKKIMDIVNSLERITMTVVDEVPTVETAEPNKLYLVDEDGDGRYEEYIYAEIDGVPTIVELGPIVDFSAYYTSAEVDALLLPITTELNDLSFVKNIEKTNTGSYVITFRDDTTLPIAVDTTVTENSTNLVTSGAVHEAIEKSVESLHIELTQAEYDALTPEEKNNGAEYFITDPTDSGDFSYLENRINALDGKSNTLNEIATLEVTDVKGVIHTSASPKYTFIKNKGENDCYISETDDVGEDIDGTILLQSNSTVMLENVSDVNYICKSGETTIICVCFQNSVNDPFTRVESAGSSGGDSSTLGVEEVILWEYDPNTMQIGQNITLSDKFSNYDEIYFDSYYNVSSVLQPTTRAGGSIYLSALFADASDTNRQYLSVNGVAQGSPEFCDFYYDGSLTLYVGAVQALWVGKIIGRRYTKVSPTGYRRVTLWENTGTTNPDSISLTEAITNFDEIRVVAHQNTAGNNLLETSFTVSEIGSQSMVLYALLSNYGTYSLTNSATLTKIWEDGSQGFYVYKIIGIKY